MPVPAIFYVYCCESPVKPTHQVGRFYHTSFQNCHIAAIGEKNRQVCPQQSVAKIACDFRWRSNYSPRSAYKIARCVAIFTWLLEKTKERRNNRTMLPISTLKNNAAAGYCSVLRPRPLSLRLRMPDCCC